MVYARGDASYRANAHPEAFVRDVLTQTRSAFVNAYGESPLLLVRVVDLASDLAHGLAENPTAAGAHLKDSIGYATVVAGRGRPAHKPQAGPDRFDPIMVRTLLTRAAYFIVPLRKRAGAGKAFTSRISVGRARNNDVVLRDPSVSKFHAWFERDERDVLYLADARSKNTTSVNGAMLEATDVIPLNQGDQVVFGTVEARLCSAETLWDALQETP
jgi:hypothetical protein